MKREAKFAWLAGIIDGEGHISLNKRVPSQRTKFPRPHIYIGNTDGRMIRAISEVYSEITNLKWYYTYHRRNNPNHNDMVMIMVLGLRNVRNLLQAVIPYLNNKKEQAELVLEYCNWRIGALENAKSRNDFSDGLDKALIYEENIKSMRKNFPDISSISRKPSTIFQCPLSSQTNT